MKDGTRVIRACFPPGEQGGPFLGGPVFAGPYHLEGDPAAAPYAYGRHHNPTWSAYERALTELEGGSSTVVFSSGMAAVTAVFGSVLKPKDVLVLPSDAYYATRSAAEAFLTSMGVEVRHAPTAGDALRGSLPNARLLWLESPSNPGLDVCDIASLAGAARAAGALVAVDNTTATCLGQSPLRLGADFSVSSDTKATTGHSDLVLGHVCVRDGTLAERLRGWRTRMGAVPGPMEAWLAHRSLATLDVRLQRQCGNALALAGFLAARPDVRALRYPGLLGDPAYTVASRQMKYFGPVVSFVLSGRGAAERFLRSCELVFEATSFGGVHTTAERRARWGGDEVPEGFIRMSVGCEDAEDLMEDIRRALDGSA
jgi:cystathionine gamma-lyase